MALNVAEESSSPCTYQSEKTEKETGKGETSTYKISGEKSFQAEELCHYKGPEAGGRGGETEVGRAQSP